MQHLLEICCGDGARRQAPFLVHGPPGHDGDEFRRTLVLEANGDLVAVGTLWRHWLHPRYWRLSLHVHPGLRQRGLGTSLYRRLLRVLSAQPPALGRDLMTATHADDADGRRFLERRGFELLMRTRLALVDPQRLGTEIRKELARAAMNAEGAGYRFQAMPELAARDPDIGLVLARLHAEVYRDGHAWDPPAAIGDQDATAVFLDDAELIPAALFAATIGGIPAAVGSLRRTKSSSELELGWVGTTRRHREHVSDLTLGLLGRCLDFAADWRSLVRIEIDEADGPLWAATKKLPIAADPDWLTFIRTGPAPRS
jgi:GNAT superfamily N-acetyltransferase